MKGHAYMPDETHPVMRQRLKANDAYFAADPQRWQSEFFADRATFRDDPRTRLRRMFARALMFLRSRRQNAGTA